MSAYFSLGSSVESRIIQSQEPKSAGEKMTRKKKARGNLPSFSPCTLFKTRSGPTIWTPRSRSSSLFARNRTETLAREAKKTVQEQASSGEIGSPDRTNLKIKKRARTKMSLKKGLQGLIMDNTNLRSCQDLASANNSLFHNYLSAEVLLT